MLLIYMKITIIIMTVSLIVSFIKVMKKDPRTYNEQPLELLLVYGILIFFIPQLIFTLLFTIYSFL